MEKATRPGLAIAAVFPAVAVPIALPSLQLRKPTPSKAAWSADCSACRFC